MSTYKLIKEMKLNKEKLPATFSLIERVDYINTTVLKIYSPYYNGYFNMKVFHKKIHRLL
ncbi:hypothetical protein ACM39_16535 [Chryseobacterium sp. FH2]|nr:hypothetical protein ACM39_16535 [Chryseobacterium sp. FH2]